MNGLSCAIGLVASSIALPARMSLRVANAVLVQAAPISAVQAMFRDLTDDEACRAACVLGVERVLKFVRGNTVVVHAGKVLVGPGQSPELSAAAAGQGGGGSISGPPRSLAPRDDGTEHGACCSGPGRDDRAGIGASHYEESSGEW